MPSIRGHSNQPERPHQLAQLGILAATVLAARDLPLPTTLTSDRGKQIDTGQTTGAREYGRNSKQPFSFPTTCPNSSLELDLFRHMQPSPAEGFSGIAAARAHAKNVCAFRETGYGSGQLQEAIVCPGLMPHERPRLTPFKGRKQMQRASNSPNI